MEVTIPLSTREEALALFGLGDRNLKLLRDALGVKITARNDVVRLQGERSSVASNILRSLLGSLRAGGSPPEDFVERELARVVGLPTEGTQPVAEASLATGGDAGYGPTSAGPLPASGAARLDVPYAEPPSRVEASTRPSTHEIGAPHGGAFSAARDAAAPSVRSPSGAEGQPAPTPGAEDRGISATAERGVLSAEQQRFVASLARSSGQAGYLADMLRDEIVFSVGPAGTGKTFLAVNVAVHFLREGAIRRLILCRPAVEAGEKLGFLPGDFQEKINPYLRPLYDSLNDVLGFEQVKRYLEREIIEIIPLAYMRGRTLNNAYIIFDEAQNTTVSQMKMFLTRMGANSRIIVNGDPTQVDLPSGQPSGLIHAQRVIRNIRGISWAALGRSDIVRHPLVQRIVEAYEAETQADAPPPGA